mmetsp:Transcript_19729/g.53654  ORF Transcript_19729/g.53654 Transcript_19729/m.53654 type:complete len:278 (-) Transcript_19729:299-1132(-)
MDVRPGAGEGGGDAGHGLPLQRGGIQQHDPWPHLRPQHGDWPGAMVHEAQLLRREQRLGQCLRRRGHHGLGRSGAQQGQARPRQRRRPAGDRPERLERRPALAVPARGPRVELHGLLRRRRHLRLPGLRGPRLPQQGARRPADLEERWLRGHLDRRLGAAGPQWHRLRGEHARHGQRGRGRPRARLRLRARGRRAPLEDGGAQAPEQHARDRQARGEGQPLLGPAHRPAGHAGSPDGRVRPRRRDGSGAVGLQRPRPERHAPGGRRQPAGHDAEGCR